MLQRHGRYYARRNDMRRMGGVCLWLAFGWTAAFNPGCGTGVIGEADGLRVVGEPEIGQGFPSFAKHSDEPHAL